MSKHGMKGTPPKVGVTNKQAKKEASKIVDLRGDKINKEEKPTDDGVMIDPRLMHMGQFAIPQAHIRSQFDDVSNLMQDIVIVDATLKMTTQGNMVVYTGISPKYFKAVPEGSMMSMYNIGKRLDGVFVVEPAITMPPPNRTQ